MKFGSKKAIFGVICFFVQINRATRAGGSAGDNNGPVPETDELVHCQSSGSVLDVEGRGDLT